MRKKHFLAAQAWYGISQGAPSFLNPFLNLFFHRIGLRPSQIGLLTALRPWISAPCGSIIAGLADRWGTHRAFLVATYLGMTFTQGLMALTLFSSFGGMLTLTILASIIYTPASIIADAAVMAASTHPGDYGRLRTWASVAWTVLAPLAGWVNSRFGIRVGIVCYVLGSLLAVPAAWMLPVEALTRKVAPIIERGASGEAEEALPPAAELEQPLLAEEAPAPTPTTARYGLTKALAIVRFIETITELGVVPPSGASLYGYTALPIQYASQHLAPVEETAPEADLPGYSPFAGGAEPGSESPPPSSTPPANGMSTADTATKTAAGGTHGNAAASPLPPTYPDAAEAVTTVAHGLLQSPSSLQQRGTSLPRPINADNLPRVASLQAGIPRVRTRPQLLVPQEDTSEEEEEEEPPSPPSPDSGVLLTPHSSTQKQLSHERTGAEEGAMFDADDVTAAAAQAQHAHRTWQQQQQPQHQRGLQGAKSATLLLRDVRGIHTSAPAGAAVWAGGVGQEVGGEQPGAVTSDLPVSYGSPIRDVEIKPEAAATLTLAPQHPPAAEQEPAPAATPVYRSAAVQRLAQIFGGTTRTRGSRAADRAGAGGSVAEVEPGTAPGTLASEPSSVVPEDGGFTPVQQYLDYRQGKLQRKRQAREKRARVAEAEGQEPEPPTPLPSSASGWAGALFGSITPSLAAVAQLQQPHLQAVDAEAMREALQQELLEAEHEHDPTGSLIVGMLSKKLERMAAEKQQRQRRRAARHTATEPAAATPAGNALPERAAPSLLEHEGRAAGDAGKAGMPGAEALAEEQPPLGFGASLKRLFRDPQVSTFFFLTTVLGFGHGIIGGFLFMYLAEIGGSEMLMGYILVANSLPELPAFFFFGAILTALGMNTVLLTAAASLGLRIWAYSLLPTINLNWIVAIETLHAVTYACGWSASAVNSSKIAPPGLESTTQGIFQGLWTGVGCGVAGLVGGILYGSHGPELLFRLSGLAIIVATAAAAVVMLVLRWKRKHRVPLPPGSDEKLPLLAH